MADLDVAITTRMLSLVSSTIDFVRCNGLKRVGVVSTPTTVNSGLYNAPLLALGINCIVPNDQQLQALEAVIRGTIAGKTGFEPLLQNIVDDMMLRGCEAVILGCTELSLVGKNFTNCIDPLTIVVDMLLPQL